MSKHNRRSFLKNTGGLLISSPFLGRLASVTPPAALKFDPSFGTATQALQALRSGVISSRELTAHTFHRIKNHNPKINAFVTLLEDQAMQQAKQADEALARRRSPGRLHGLPILIKDSFSTAGVKTTSGSTLLKNYVPKQDAVAVARLKAAGAIVIGKTNLPEFAGDWQSYNDVAGTTNNPWDVTRTPGGSTGGGAAALAAGMGFLELGSDIGGSIRVPAHFCGLYGHKPSLDVVPLEGHIPPPPGVVAPSTDLAVAGPLARSAQDLKLELEVIGGPPPGESIAYRWSLPAARRLRLSDYRIGFVADDPFCPVTPEVAEVFSKTLAALRKQNVKMTEGWPAGMKPQPLFENYFVLLSAILALSTPEPEMKAMREAANTPWAHYAKGWTESANILHKQWLAQAGEQLKARRIWQEYFKTHDAFLMPVAFTPAIKHDHSESMFARTIVTSAGNRIYPDMSKWISFATLTGCPATAVPVGRTKEGLPVGVQIMGPYLEDATPIHIAGLMSEVVGGFEAPPGYSD